MTTDTSTVRSGTTHSRRPNGGDPDGTEEALQVALREVRNAIQGVGRSMPEMARVSRDAVDDLIRAIDRGSDQQLAAGASLSLGLAIGMLLGGVPRPLILLALAPVAVMSLGLADRRSGTREPPATT